MPQTVVASQVKKKIFPLTRPKKKIPAPVAPAVSPKISNWRKTGLKTLGGLEGWGGLDSNRLPPPSDTGAKALITLSLPASACKRYGGSEGVVG